MLFVIIEINLILKFKRMSILTSPNFTNLKKKKVLLHWTTHEKKKIDRNLPSADALYLDSMPKPI